MLSPLLLFSVVACSSRDLKKTAQDETVSGDVSGNAAEFSEDDKLGAGDHSPFANTNPSKNRSFEVRQKAFQKNGSWVNAFYFVRSDQESWAGISQKIYGSAARAKELAAWNSNIKLAAGTVVYYNSPNRPGDSANMKSFAQDFGVPLEKYTVRKGDWLSKLALAKYGNVKLWKEIRALNPKLRNPNLIEIGQVIELAPAALDLPSSLASAKTFESEKTQAVSPAPKVETASVQNSQNQQASDEMPMLDNQSSQNKAKKWLLPLIGLLAVAALAWIVIKKRDAIQKASSGLSLRSKTKRQVLSANASEVTAPGATITEIRSRTNA